MYDSLYSFLYCSPYCFPYCSLFFSLFFSLYCSRFFSLVCFHCPKSSRSVSSCLLSPVSSCLLLPPVYSCLLLSNTLSSFFFFFFFFFSSSFFFLHLPSSSPPLIQFSTPPSIHINRMLRLASLSSRLPRSTSTLLLSPLRRPFSSGAVTLNPAAAAAAAPRGKKGKWLLRGLAGMAGVIGVSSLAVKINIDQPKLLPNWAQSYAVGVEGLRYFWI